VGSDERKHDDKTYRVIFGKPKDGDGSVEQAYRYPKESWSEEAARNHCQEHDGSFEAAEKTERFHLHVLTEKADPDAKIFPWSMPARYYLKPGRMVIYGNAVLAGQTRKGDIYTRDEVMRGARSLIGGPLELFEHSWDVGEPRWLPYPDNIVLDAEEVNTRLEYVAGVEERKVQELIRNRDINRVSVNVICRHVPASNPGLCEGMILNGFCLLHKTGIPSSPGTYVKIWNSYRIRHLESEGVPSSSESDGANKMSEKEKDKKTAQVPEPSATAPAAGIALPSVEDRVAGLEAEVAQIKESLTAIDAKLDTLIQAKPAPPPAPTQPPVAPVQPPGVATQQVKKTEQDPGESPPEEPPQREEPKTDKQRFMTHYDITEEQMDQILAWIGDDVYKLLPERGQKTKTEQMSAEEIKTRISELSKQREELMTKLYPEADLTEEQRTDLQAQLDVINSELEALEQALGQKIAEGEGEAGSEAEHVVAAVKPVEHEEPMITLTEKEIYDVLKDKRRFTPALQVNGILDLLEQKRKEAEA
jgi:hypothetical protein